MGKNEFICSQAMQMATARSGSPTTKNKKDLPSRQAPPPLWTCPIPVKGAPWTSSEKSSKRTIGRIKTEKEALMQELTQMKVKKEEERLQEQGKTRSSETNESKGTELEPLPPLLAGTCTSISNSEV